MTLDRSQTLLNAVPEPMVVIARNGQIEAVNIAWSRPSGPGALGGEGFNVGSNFIDLCAQTLPAEHAEPVIAALRDVCDGGVARVTRMYVADAGDTQRSLELVISALPDGSGALVQQFDVSERERTATTKRQVEERLQLVLELLPEGYWDWNLENDHVYYSDRWVQSLGYEVGELAPHVKAWADLLHPDDVARVLDACYGYLEGRYPTYHCETRLKRKDGSYRWNLDRGRIVARDADGKPTRIIGMEIDITERRLAEMQLEEQSKRLMDLSTPLIPISDRVVVMPLIGNVDAQRAEQVLSSLLHGLSQNRAQVAILDITGVSLIDSHVAAVLVNAARAVQLLGAQVVLTGIRPEVATILVGLDINLGNIVTRGTLQAGIAFATGEERRGRAT